LERLDDDLPTLPTAYCGYRAVKQKQSPRAAFQRPEHGFRRDERDRDVPIDSLPRRQQQSARHVVGFPEPD